MDEVWTSAQSGAAMVLAAVVIFLIGYTILTIDEHKRWPK